MIVDATIINKTPFKRWIKEQKNLKVVKKSVENRKSELQSGFVNFIRGSLSTSRPGIGTEQLLEASQGHY